MWYGMVLVQIVAEKTSDISFTYPIRNNGSGKFLPQCSSGLNGTVMFAPTRLTISDY